MGLYTRQIHRISHTFRFRNTIHNTSTGIINVNNNGRLELFGNVPVLNNDGVVTINSGGTLFNDGTVNNQNLIEVKCGGSLTGSGAYTGNPVQTSDCTPPGVTLNQASGQADPTSASPINFEVLFSEPVSGFNGTDVSLSGTAGATTAVVTGGPTSYNVAVSGMTSSGTVIAAIPANAATDAAGNGNTASTSSDNTVTYNVIYNFAGFFSPVDNFPVLNVIKAGSGVPVIFSLGGDQGLNIFAAGYPTSRQVACDGDAPSDEVETVAAGGSGLSYDPATDTYTYVWKTQKRWAGQCRQLVVRLSDGSEHVASFRFK